MARMVAKDLRNRLCVGLALGLLWVSGPSTAAPREAQRELFATALAAVQADQPLVLPAALRDYPLRPYLEGTVVQRLIARDRPEADAAWAAFRRQHADSPWLRDLEREWWRSLGRRQAWEQLAQAMPAPPDIDDLRCLGLRARLETGGDASLVADTQAVFRTGHSLPEACTRPFEWLRDSGHRPPALVLERLQLALEAREFGLARYLLRLLPEDQRAAPTRALRLRSDPGTAIPALLADPPARLPVDDLMAGWQALTRANPDGAAQLAPRLAALRGLDDDHRAAIWSGLGLRQSWSRLPTAVGFFRKGQAADELTHAWRIRAALWAGDWAQALRWLETLPETMAAEPRWRYWRARAEAAEGRADVAQAGFEGLLDANNVYALLAAWRLGRPLSPRPQPGAPADPAQQARLAADPTIARMRELHALDIRNWFNLEWFAFMAGRAPADADQVSRFAFQQGWWLHGVAAATQARVFDDFVRLYPRPYDAGVMAAARQTDLPPALIYGLIRQESLFEPRAQSPAKAYGLMQLLLPTARGVARRHDLPIPEREDLFEPTRNIPLGARYLMEMRERFGGQWLPAIGAYNAGPNAVARWLPEDPMAPDVWMENIPYNETREYIGKLLWHQAVFGWLASGQPQQPGDFLRPVVAITP